jgi:hypothetical protein
MRVRLEVAPPSSRGAEPRVRVADTDALKAKVLLLDLHGRRGRTGLEEAWLVRSLHRDQ